MHTLRLYLQSADPGKTLEALCAHPAFLEPPLRLEVDDEYVGVTGWREILARADEMAFSASALWSEPGDRPDTRPQIIVSQGTISVVIPRAFRDISELLEILVSLPFSLCEVGSILPGDSFGRDEDRCASIGLGLALRGERIRLRPRGIHFLR